MGQIAFKHAALPDCDQLYRRSRHSRRKESVADTMRQIPSRYLVVCACAWQLKAKFLILIVVVKLECCLTQIEQQIEKINKPRSSYGALNVRCINCVRQIRR